MAFEARFVRVPRLAAAAIAAWLLLPAAAGAINVCGDGVCQKTGIPDENSTNCPADCGGGSTEPRLPSVLLGLTSCAWGAADCNPPLTGSSAIHQVNHGLSIAALYLTGAIIADRGQSTAIADYGGLLNRMPIAAASRPGRS